MRKSLFGPLLCFFFLLFSSLAYGDDFQYWQEFSLIKSISSDWNIQFDSSARFRDHARKAFYYYVEIDLVRKVSCDWVFSLGYRHFYKLNDENQWINEPTPLAFCIKKWKWGSWAFSHRHRVEYRTRSHGPWLYRSRLEWEWPMLWNFRNLCGCTLGGFLGEWRPYTHDEVFFQEGHGFNQNRIQVGVKREIVTIKEGEKKKKGVFSIAYLWKQDRHTDGLWDTTDVLRCKFEWTF